MYHLAIDGSGCSLDHLTTEWAAPVVPVVKSDGSVHICGNFHLKSKD